MQELDVLLNRFIDTCYVDLTASQRDSFDSLLNESDVDLYRWFTGRTTPGGTTLTELVEQIRRCGD